MDALTKELLRDVYPDAKSGARAFFSLRKQASPLVGALIGAPVGGLVGYKKAKSGELFIDQESLIRKKKALGQKVSKTDKERLAMAKSLKNNPAKLAVLTSILGASMGAGLGKGIKKLRKPLSPPGL